MHPNVTPFMTSWQNVRGGFVRWFIFGAALFGAVWVVIHANRHYTHLLLRLALVAGVYAAVRQLTRLPFVRVQVERLQTSDFVLQHRVAIVRGLVVVALVMLIASVQVFRLPALDYLEAHYNLLLQALALLTGGILALGAALHLMPITFALPQYFASPSKKNDKGQSGLWLFLGMLVLGLWLFIRIVNTPLPWTDTPMQDVLAVNVLLALKQANIPLVTNASGVWQFGLMLLGVLLIAAGSVRLPKFRRIAFLTGLLLLMLVAEINGSVYDILSLQWVTTHVQLGLLLLSLMLLTLSLGGATLQWPPIAWETVLTLTGLTLLGLVVRFWQLDTSVRVLVDELFFTTAIHDVRVNPYVGLLTPYSSISAFPYVFPYFQAQTVELFGSNFVGLRAASAIMGTLMIPLLYFLGHALFDRRTALVGAFLLAVLPPHIHFSRLGIIEIGGTLAGLAALAWLARAVMHNRRLDYALAGTLLGLTHYFHEGSRLLFTPLAVIWVMIILALWRLGGRERLVNLIVCAVMLVIVAAPIYYTLIGIERPLFARLDDDQIRLPTEYFSRILASGDFAPHLNTYTYQSLMIYLRQNDTSLFYGPAPLTTLWMAPVLLLGIGVLVWRWRSPGALLLGLWLIGTSLGNNVLFAPANSPRYVVAFPALALIAAVGLRCGLSLLVPAKWWGRVAVLLAVMAIGTLEIDYYFNQHLPLYNHHFREVQDFRDAQDAVIRSLNFPSGTHIHVISENPPAPDYAAGLLTFMRGDMVFHDLRPSDVTPDYLNGLDKNIDHAFFIEPENYTSVSALNEQFYLLPPALSPYPDVALDKQFMLYYAPDLPDL